MGLLSKLKKRLTEELKKVSDAEQSQYSEFDKQTIEELRELGLLDDGTAHIESKRCNWEKETTRPNRRTANLSKAYAAETPIGKGIATKSREQEEKTRSRER